MENEVLRTPDGRRLDNFIMRGEWVDNISTFPIEIQDKILGDIARYGSRKPTQHDDDPIVYSIVNMLKGGIDNSVNEYLKKVGMSQSAGRKKKVSDTEIHKLASEGKSAEQIAEELGCSLSSVNHSDGWKNRKVKDATFNF